MLLTNEIGCYDHSDIIVQDLPHGVLLHLREMKEDGSVVGEARMYVDKSMMLQLINFLQDNIPDTKTRAEEMAELQAKLARSK